MSTNAYAGVHLPLYPLVAGPLLQAFEHASSVTTASSDDDGEFYSMVLAAVLAPAAVPNESIIVVPLTPPEDGEVLDFTYVARSQALFVQVHEKPFQRMTYGHVLGYSAGIVDPPLAMEMVLKFPTSTSFIVAKPRLVEAIRAATGHVVDIQLVPEASKRQCVRPLELVGEQAEDTGEKQKGTSIYLIDLENVKRYTRTKTDLTLREKELNFMYRAMDVDKQEFGVTSDCVIQPEAYRSMLSEQADSQSEDRHKAFTACGLVSRVQKLPLFRLKEKLKLLLIGSVLLEGFGEATLTLEDFVTGEKISNRAAVCPANNAGLIGALKNFQIVLQIIFSDAYENCLDAFIDNLEGMYRPMELVAADFLRHMTEVTVRRFFRVVRSVKTSATQESLATPEKCAAFLTTGFDKLTDVLSDHQSMVRHEALYRLRVARRSEATVADRVEVAKSEVAKSDKSGLKQTVKWAEVSPEARKSAPLRTCSAYLGSQLGATRKDGRPYVCNFGKDCSFAHISVSGKTNEKLMEIVSSMAPNVKADLTKAVNSRK